MADYGGYESEEQLEAIQRAYKNVFLGESTAREGQLVLVDLMNKCKIFGLNGGDPHKDAILGGKRSIGIHIFFMTALSPAYGGQIDILDLANITKILEGAHDTLSTIKTMEEENDDDR